MMRKIKLACALVLALALVACFSMLVSCGGDEGEGTTVTTAPITTPTTKPTTPSTSNGTTDTSAPGTTDTSAPGTGDEECTEHKGGTATCTKKAECEVCGEEYGDYAPHTEETVEGKEATCTEAGLTDGKKCSVCEAVIEAQTEIPVADHTWSLATCVAPKTCTVCELTEGEKLDHVYDVEIEVVAPTCMAGGYTLYGCSSGECGTTETRDETEKVEAHSFAPLADLEKYDVIVCEFCGLRCVNITTVITKIEEKFCLGNCGATDEIPCSCETVTEYIGYEVPIAPEAIVAGEAFTKEVNDACLIKLVCEAGASFVITVGGEELTVNGTELYVDISKYEFDSIIIVSDADATVVFYKTFE